MDPRPPRPSPGLVVFAHGSGSSRLGPRNTYVARRLRAQGLGTLVFDLLTEREAADRRNVFDIPLLAGRMVEAVRFARSDAQLSPLPVGLFGASTGAAAALVAAAELPRGVAAAVSRGGRPDLAGAALGKVRAATLPIVGGADYGDRAQRDALTALGCEKRLEIVPAATHPFEEPGTLDKAVDLAAGCFSAHLGAART